MHRGANYLFVSTHVDDLYPHTGFNDDEHASNILNLGMRMGTGREDFMHYFKNKILPRLEEFKPEMIFISAGFDSHYQDPTKAMVLDEDDFYDITLLLKDVAKRHSSGRLVSVLEGGYNLQYLALCSQAHLLALLGVKGYVPVRERK